MLVSRPETNHQDSRGVIVDLLPDGFGVNAVTYLTMVAGSIRGNHYHEKTDQWLYVVSGKLRAYARSADGREESCISIAAGDLVMNPAGERHAFQALTSSKLVAFSCGPRRGKDYEQDTIRLEQPLVDQK